MAAKEKAGAPVNALRRCYVSEPYEMAAHELTEAYRERTLMPEDVLDNILARMDSVEPALNAFCCRDDAGARHAAYQSTARWASGAPLGKLDGIPISVKDLVDVAGMPTRYGSAATDDSPAKIDAPCVLNLRTDGAIILGKTTTPEFGHKGVTDSPLTGVTRNPWNIGMTTGGSSGGAAAALASGMGPLAVGTDGGGSCRKPANYCGLVGMKPSLGRVPLAATGGFWPLSSPGPMTRNVRDAANLLAVMARPQVSVPAGTFQAKHFVFPLRGSGKPPEHVWYHGDDLLLVKIRWDLLKTTYVLAKYEF
ncbi:amidase family protein [bacterium]|nr:amidase family protein [bacterium]